MQKAINEMKRQPVEGEKIFANNVSDKSFNIQSIQRTHKTQITRLKMGKGPE